MHAATSFVNNIMDLAPLKVCCWNNEQGCFLYYIFAFGHEHEHEQDKDGGKERETESMF